MEGFKQDMVKKSNFLKKNIKILLFLFITIIIFLYLMTKNDCSQAINYVPSYEGPTLDRASFYKREGYYEITKNIKNKSIPEKFKTRKEALNYCISKKLINKN